jgi:uncharacterized membrane protein YadS
LVHALPVGAKMLHLDAYVAGAWFGGSVDAAGAARAASALGDPTAVKVATSVARIQGGMLGLIALVVAVYWLTSVTPRTNQTSLRQSVSGFPTAVIGLLAASAVSSFILLPLLGADAMQELARATGELRGWCFTLAAAGLGMELNVRTLMLEAERGKSIALLGVGVVLDAVLTLIVAQQVFGHALAAIPR